MHVLYSSYKLQSRHMHSVMLKIKLPNAFQQEPLSTACTYQYCVYLLLLPVPIALPVPTSTACRRTCRSVAQ